MPPSLSSSEVSTCAGLWASLLDGQDPVSLVGKLSSRMLPGLVRQLLAWDASYDTQAEDAYGREAMAVVGRLVARRLTGSKHGLDLLSRVQAGPTGYMSWAIQNGGLHARDPVELVWVRHALVAEADLHELLRARVSLAEILAMGRPHEATLEKFIGGQHAHRMARAALCGADVPSIPAPLLAQARAEAIARDTEEADAAERLESAQRRMPNDRVRPIVQEHLYRVLRKNVVSWTSQGGDPAALFAIAQAHTGSMAHFVRSVAITAPYAEAGNVIVFALHRPFKPVAVGS